MHIATRPREAFRRFISWRSVAVSLAPVHPSGWPRAIAVDSRGNAYIADYGNHAIRMVVGGALP